MKYRLITMVHTINTDNTIRLLCVYDPLNTDITMLIIMNIIDR